MAASVVHLVMCWDGLESVVWLVGWCGCAGSLFCWPLAQSTGELWPGSILPLAVPCERLCADAWPQGCGTVLSSRFVWFLGVWNGVWLAGRSWRLALGWEQQTGLGGWLGGLDWPPSSFTPSLVSIQGMAGGYAQIFEMNWSPGSPVLVGSVLAICMGFSYAY